MGNISCGPKNQNQYKQVSEIVSPQSPNQQYQSIKDFSTVEDVEPVGNDPLTKFLSNDSLNTVVNASSDLMEYLDYSKLHLDTAKRLCVRLLLLDTNKMRQFFEINDIEKSQLSLLDSDQLLKVVQHSLIKTQACKDQTFAPIQIKIENFIKIKKQSISQYYQLSTKIGQGAFGSVYKARCLKSNQLRAVKVLKQKKMPEGQKINLLAQIQLLKKLDHPQIIKLYDLFFYNNFYYVVTEFCEGGSVLSILKKNIVTVPIIIKIMKQLLSGLAYLHDNGIVHRDIKIQNMVLMKPVKSQNDEIDIKLIDFGLASTFKKNKMNKTGHVGTYQYMAPEVIKGTFNQKCDVWSCGVILYKLLIGKMPFKGKNAKQTIAQILQKQINFRQKQFTKIDTVFKDLLAAMLQKNPQKRIPINRAMRYDCFKDKNYSQLQIQGNLVANLSNYNRGNNLITVVESFLSIRKINQEERKKLADIFNRIDKNGDGTIDIQELIQTYQKATGIQKSVQVDEIVNRIDHNKSGKIDFSEFLIAMYSRQRLFNEASLVEAFEHFDTDKTGYIQKKQIKQALAGCEITQIKTIFQTLDKDCDTKISKEEFISYLSSAY